MMNKAEVLKVLKKFQREKGIRYGILSLGIFGSAARESSTPTSDVDVVVELKTPDLLVLSRIRIELEERLHRPVDLVRYRERMNGFLKRRIQEEACYV